MLGMLAGCQPPPRIAAAPSCDLAWPAAWSADSTMALCLPPGFSPHGENAWGRPSAAGGLPVDFLTVARLPSAAAVTDIAFGLASDSTCVADCMAVDSLRAHLDTVAGNVTRTETGLVTGGFAGLRRKPTVQISWAVSPDEHGFAQGWAANPATLDTLRQAVRTLRLAK